MGPIILRVRVGRSFRSLLTGGGLLLLALSGCSSPPSGGAPVDGGDAACASVPLVRAEPASATHISCTEPAQCGNALAPPTGGPHCSTLLACKSHSAAQNRCHWIHNLEHGHLVLAYHCPSGCPQTVALLQKLAAEQTRAIVLPEPSLPKQVAAIVWGYSLSLDAPDEASLRCLIAKQDVLAPEAGLPCAN